MSTFLRKLTGPGKRKLTNQPPPILPHRNVSNSSEEDDDEDDDDDDDDESDDSDDEDETDDSEIQRSESQPRTFQDAEVSSFGKSSHSRSVADYDVSVCILFEVNKKIVCCFPLFNTHQWFVVVWELFFCFRV